MRTFKPVVGGVQRGGKMAFRISVCSNVDLVIKTMLRIVRKCNSTSHENRGDNISESHLDVFGLSLTIRS